MLAEHQVYATIGEDGFDRLIRAFYRQIPSDPLLGPMYPTVDIEGAMIRLRDFLVQRFGGPARYQKNRGHPRLRMRHSRFAIGMQARDRWLTLMDQAFREAQLQIDAEQTLRAFFVHTTTFLLNDSQ
jgi:hemoglobin